MKKKRKFVSIGGNFDLETQAGAEKMEKSAKSEAALRRCAKAALLLYSFNSSNSNHQVKTFSLSLSDSL